jgi:hypothetical protein
MHSLHYRRLRVAMIEAERQAAVRLSEEGVIGATSSRASVCEATRLG